MLALGSNGRTRMSRCEHTQLFELSLLGTALDLSFSRTMGTDKLYSGSCAGVSFTGEWTWPSTDVGVGEAWISIVATKSPWHRPEKVNWSKPTYPCLR